MNTNRNRSFKKTVSKLTNTLLYLTKKQLQDKIKEVISRYINKLSDLK